MPLLRLKTTPAKHLRQVLACLKPMEFRLLSKADRIPCTPGRGVQLSLRICIRMEAHSETDSRI
jgi:hypothetical protein